MTDGELGPNAPVPSWPEYDRLRDAVEAYLDHDPPTPQYRDVWRALAATRGERQRTAFVEAFDLDCPHSPLEVDTDPEGPPHAPPASDHATLWLDADTGEPAVYSMHVYPGNIERLDAADPPYNQWFDVFQFARKWGLEVSVLPKSWYNLGRTVNIVFYPPERY